MSTGGEFESGEFDPGFAPALERHRFKLKRLAL
jgi:hypothetical protein